MSKIEFTLTITLKGENMDEIDAGLVAAAGKRIMAKMEKIPTVNGVPLNQALAAVEKAEESRNANETVAAPQVAPTEIKERKPRQKKGEPNGEIQKDNQENSQTQNGEKSQEVAKTASAQVPTASKDAAIEAVGRVNAKFGKDSASAGIEKVKECLHKFGAPSVSKMDASKYSEFIAHCDSVCA